jgi:hypothetical protein
LSHMKSKDEVCLLLGWFISHALDVSFWRVKMSFVCAHVLSINKIMPILRFKYWTLLIYLKD